MSEDINRRAAKFVFKQLSKSYDKLENKPRKLHHEYHNVEREEDFSELLPESSVVKHSNHSEFNFSSELKRMEGDIKKTVKQTIVSQEEDRFDKIFNKLNDVERKINIAKNEMKLLKDQDKDKISLLTKQIRQMNDKLDLQIYKKNSREVKMKELEEKIQKGVQKNYVKSNTIEDQLHAIEKKLAGIKGSSSAHKVKEIKERIKKTKKKIKN